MKSGLPRELQIRYEQIMRLRQEGKHICGFLRNLRAGIVGNCTLNFEICEDGVFNSQDEVHNCEVYRRIIEQKDYS